MTRLRSGRAFFVAIVAGGGLFGSPPARAEIGPDQAAALQQQMHDWLAAMLGPTVDLTHLPFRIVADGEHYRVEIQLPRTIGKPYADAGASAPITAEIKPAEGGSWAIDDLKVPSPLNIDMDAGPAGMKFSLSMKLADQKSHGVMDPTLATPSSMDGQWRGLSQTLTSSIGPQAATSQTTSVERVTWHQAWQPQAGGTMTLLGESTLDGYASSRPMKDGQELTIAIDKIHATHRVSQVDFVRFGRTVRAALDLAALGPINPKSPSRPPSPSSNQSPAKPSQRASMGPAQVVALRNLALDLGQLVGGMEGEQTMHGVHIGAAGHNASIADAAFSVGFGAPNGKTDLHMRMMLDGLDSSELPAEWHQFLPHHIVFAPRLSGLPKDAWMDVLLRAIDAQGRRDQAGQADPTKMATDLLNKAPLMVNIDALDIDFGPARLTGTGGLQLVSQANVSGEAELRMTGLEQLLQAINGAPNLRQAAPVLIFLKGIGKADGDTTIWKITYHDSKISVNGTDMSAMMPHKK